MLRGYVATNGDQHGRAYATKQQHSVNLSEGKGAAKFSIIRAHCRATASVYTVRKTRFWRERYSIEGGDKGLKFGFLSLNCQATRQATRQRFKTALR